MADGAGAAIRVLRLVNGDGSGDYEHVRLYVVGTSSSPQDAIFVNHVLTVPAGDTGRELPVRAGDARELVEVNLPGGSLPPDPADGIIIEEQPAACRYPPGQFQSSLVSCAIAASLARRDDKAHRPYGRFPP